MIRGDHADIAIEDGVIRSVGPELPGGATEIDARGLAILPGVIDVHVHFNEPGRAEWEGAATGSRAFAAGGGTLFFDMPLNSTPCTVDAAAFDAKRTALEQASLTDFALWGGLVPGHIGDLPELAERGAIGFKAFLSDSGLPEFGRADDETLFAGLQVAAKYDLPVGVHAESEEITSRLWREAIAQGRWGVRDYLASRPVEAEVAAIERATELAGIARAKLHVVHVSSGRGVAAALEARARGVDVSIETCPHYLFFTEEDMERIGAVAKCAPPLRGQVDRDELWARVLDGGVDLIGSDHSPAPAEMKQCDDFFRIWGGIAGVQSTLPVLLKLGVPLERVAELLARVPARRFGIAGKGAIQVGMDADLVLVRMEAFRVERESLLQRHGLSPYVGCELRGIVERTLLRGQTIYEGGRASGEVRGRFVRGKAAVGRL
jgi:allantoinase